MRKLQYQIPASFDGIRVEDYLKSQFGFSRRILTRLKQRRGSILVNQKHIRMVDVLLSGDVIDIVLEDESDGCVPNFELEAELVYEDEDVIVYNKPFDMPVHPCRNHKMNTLGNVFAAHCAHTGRTYPFRPINRLDRDTTGLCVIAKNALAASNLSGKVDKEYTALLCGNLPENAGTIDLPIARVDEIGIQRCVHPAGQRSVTQFEVIGRGGGYTLVRVKLITGRTHQIRVHFSHKGYPLAGDRMYGGDGTLLARQALDCNKVNFIHPTTGKYTGICINIHLDIAKACKIAGIL